MSNESSASARGLHHALQLRVKTRAFPGQSCAMLMRVREARTNLRFLDLPSIEAHFFNATTAVIVVCKRHEGSLFFKIKFPLNFGTSLFSCVARARDRLIIDSHRARLLAGREEQGSQVGFGLVRGWSSSHTNLLLLRQEEHL